MKGAGTPGTVTQNAVGSRVTVAHIVGDARLGDTEAWDCLVNCEG